VTSNESGTFDIGSKSVHRLGFGAMRLCGDGIIGAPDDEAAARDLVRTAVDRGVDFISGRGGYPEA
jgi:pyridoxine 4-dehydrogenase